MKISAKNTIGHLLLLSVIGAAIGAYHISTTVFIAKDGVDYVRYAQRLNDKPISTVRSSLLQPGYPALILGVNKIAAAVGGSVSPKTWVVSAQMATLICRIMAVIVLYLLGRILVGPSPAFWAAFIVVILPDPAKYGSDVLSDWPHFLLVSVGLYLLAVHYRIPHSALIFLVGIAAGLAYLIRPEGVQLLVYGFVWLIVIFVRPPEKSTRVKTLISAGLLFAGFTIIALPYIKLTGFVFPEKRLIPLHVHHDVRISDAETPTRYRVHRALLLPPQVADGLEEIANSICETLVYYFVPALVVGLFSGLRRKTKPRLTGLVVLFIMLNVVMLLWQYKDYRVLSRRYTMPLVLLTALYIPGGIQIISRSFSWLFTKPLAGVDVSSRRWFVFLVAVGVCICTPKLIAPLHAQTHPFALAVDWLRENTTPDDFISAADSRIGFYAQRRMTLDLRRTDVAYSVRECPTGAPLKSSPGYEPAYSVPIDDASQLVIYRKSTSPAGHTPTTPN